MPKTNKVTRMLKLYYQLLVGKNLNKENFCEENGISERSFDRDIEDIRLFLSDEQAYCELDYDRKNNTYYLTQTLGEEMPIETAFLLIDILLSLKTITKAETEGVIEEVISATGLHAGVELKEYIINKFNLKNKWGDKSILKMHRDIAFSIYNKKAIDMQYEIADGSIKKRTVFPVSIETDDGFFYMRAFIIGRENDSPAFFRLDRIKSFKILNQYRFDEEKVITYLDDCKSRGIYHMLAGEKVDIKLKVRSSFGRVIADVFPNNTLISSANGNYSLYRISTYKQGFINWVLGQEDVYVMEPTSIQNEIVDRLHKSLELYNVKLYETGKEIDDGKKN
jgi:predicted DNA-binding transcriptional regulator YafY